MCGGGRFQQMLVESDPRISILIGGLGGRFQRAFVEIDPPDSILLGGWVVDFNGRSLKSTPETHSAILYLYLCTVTC